MRKISIKWNASFLVGAQRTERCMNVAYCLCLAISTYYPALPLPAHKPAEQEHQHVLI